jgi:lipid A 4'-phosphatase
MNRAVLKDFLVPLALLFALTFAIAVTGSDLLLEQRFYLPGTGWPYGELNPWKFLYRFGIYPAMAMAVVSLLLVLASFFSVRALMYRKAALFFLLLMLLGPGLLVNTVLKDHWGRPRPRQMQLFGGDRAFHQVWERGEAGQGKSSRNRARAALAAGLCYGLLMGFARMAQGGHFPSDVVWAGGIVYLVGLALYHLLGLDTDAGPESESAC